MIAPAYQLLDDKLVANWKTYVENSGNLVLSCCTGQKTIGSFISKANFRFNWCIRFAANYLNSKSKDGRNFF